MASEVLSGTGSVSYTNNTGQNVRIVINFMTIDQNTDFENASPRITFSWAGVSYQTSFRAIGRNIAFSNSFARTFGGLSSTEEVEAAVAGFNMAPFGQSGVSAAPTEIMLKNGQTFSASCIKVLNSFGATPSSVSLTYNIVVIPEGG